LQEAALRLRIPFAYVACLVGGTLIGAIFGEKVVPWVEDMYGDPSADVFFGLLGAFFAVIAYEVVAMFVRPD
jgi:xanthosine utilization system XapX-like protein